MENITKSSAKLPKKIAKAVRSRDGICTLAYGGCEGVADDVHHLLYRRNGAGWIDSALAVLVRDAILKADQIGSWASYLTMSCKSCHGLQHDTDRPQGMIPGKVTCEGGFLRYSGPDGRAAALIASLNELLPQTVAGGKYRMAQGGQQ